MKVVDRIVPIDLHACELEFECADESIDKTLSDVMIMHRLYVTDHSIIVMRISISRTNVEEPEAAGL